MKKVISLLLALLMAFSLTLPSFAVSEENQYLSAAEVEEAVEVAVAALVGASDNAIVIVDDELTDDAGNTPKEISGLLSGFIFVEKDKAEAVAAENGIDIAGGNYSAMSYSHVAGELALHMILAALSKDTASWNPISAWIYERAGIADLNVDEDRVPAVLLQAFGDAFVKLISFVISIIG